MLYVITGGSGSGKSEYAEKLATKLKGEHSLHYIATMYPYEDEETRARIARHRAQRSGRGFETIEQPLRISELKDRTDMENALLECMSNLLANEMYQEDGGIQALFKPVRDEKYNQYVYDVCDNLDTDRLVEQDNKDADDIIIKPVMELAGRLENLIIVTNEIFSDGNTYDIDTEEYVRLLGYINKRLCEMADCVVEVVCGIPMAVKGEVPC